MTSATFHDTADQLTVLAGIFQTPGSALRAHALRRANKGLVALEAFFTSDLMQQANHWRRAREALAKLNVRKEAVDENQAQIDALSKEIARLQESMARWAAQSDSERAKILQAARKAEHYLEHRLDKHEAHILHRYERFEALRALVPYADNAEHLCEAIHHYENRNKYEENIVRLEKKKEQAVERLASVKRGFYLAVGLCALIVTIPLCAPFAVSLWNRKREIENQIANIEETSRREEKRLQAADEGVVASQEIREVLGNVPLEVVRSTLAEVKELRTEFQRAEKSNSVTATLLAFIDLYRPKLEELFGDIPAKTCESFAWLAQKIDDVHNVEAELTRLNAERETFRQRNAKLLRGHSRGILKDSIANLVKVEETEFALPVDSQVKGELSDLFVRMPALLSEARQALGFVSHGSSVDANYWGLLHFKLQSMANVMNACVLDMDLSQAWTTPDLAGNASSRTGTAGVAT